MSSYPPRQFKHPLQHHPHRLSFQSMSEASEDASRQAIPAEPASLPSRRKRRGEFFPMLNSSDSFQFEDDALDVQALATRETPAMMPEIAQHHGELLIPPKLSLRPQGLLWPKTGQATNASQS